MATNGSTGVKGAVVTVAALVVIGGVAVLATRGTQPGTSPPPRGPGGAAEAPKTAPVTIAGTKFTLELALDDPTRFKGLSDRTEIAPDGGMLFVFDRPETRAFVMRDCPIPIDIIYLDGAGRVVSMHAMVPEPPRSEAEKVKSPPSKNAPAWVWTNAAYESRLKQYPSGFATQFVVELRGKTLEGLSLKKGDKVEFDLAGLKKWAK